jgi:hypothetical protein
MISNFCPVCDKRLVRKYEGLVCRNFLCPLYFKLEIGWVLLTRDTGWSIKRQQINAFYDSSTRLRLAKMWIDKKEEILIRDDYTCTKCKGELNHYYYKPILHVHHIISCSEEMALFFDNDNLITLCEKCHDEIHSFDKHKFGDKYGSPTQ